MCTGDYHGDGNGRRAAAVSATLGAPLSFFTKDTQ